MINSIYLHWIVSIFITTLAISDCFVEIHPGPWNLLQINDDYLHVLTTGNLGTLIHPGCSSPALWDLAWSDACYHSSKNKYRIANWFEISLHSHNTKGIVSGKSLRGYPYREHHCSKLSSFSSLCFCVLSILWTSIFSAALFLHFLATFVGFPNPFFPRFCFAHAWPLRASYISKP